MCHLRHLVLFIFMATSLSLASSQDAHTIRQIRDCLSHDGAVVCLKERALDVLNETIMSEKPLTIYGIFDIVKDPSYIHSHEDAFLPRETNRRNARLNELIYEKIEEFFESRSVKVNIGHMFEGRGKKDKNKGGMLMMGGLAMAGMMAQMFMGKIAFMAGAALLVAKLALLLSTVIGFKKLSGGNGGGRDLKGNMLILGGLAMAGFVSQLVMGSVGFMAGSSIMMAKSGLLYLSTKNLGIKEFFNTLLNDFDSSGKKKNKIKDVVNKIKKKKKIINQVQHDKDKGDKNKNKKKKKKKKKKGQHTGGYDGDHFGGHGDGHGGGYDDGHSGGHDGGHGGGHDYGHSGGHDNGHSGGHDTGYSQGHDHGYNGSHDGEDLLLLQINGHVDLLKDPESEAHSDEIKDEFLNHNYRTKSKHT